MRLSVDVLGARGELRAEGALGEELARDFAAFAASGEAAPDFTVSAALAPVPADPLEGRPGRRWRDARFAESGGARLLDWGGRAAGRLEHGPARLTLRSPELALLRELAYLGACSLAAAALDRRGWHRVHALGVERGGGAGLLLLPEGGGKSTIALELLRRPGTRLLADDAPVLGPDGRVHPFPMRLGLRAGADVTGIPAASIRPFERRRHGLKRLVDWSWVGSRAAPAVPPRALVVGRPGGAACRARPASLAALPALLRELVVGAGLPQAAEFLWPRGLGGWLDAAWLGLARAEAGGRLLRSCRVWTLELGPDPAESARVFAALLDAS